jgi:VWFA-related protein
VERYSSQAAEVEALAYFHGKVYLYRGCQGSYVGVAIADGSFNRCRLICFQIRAGVKLMKSAIHIKPLLAAIAVISWIGAAQAQARPPSPEIPSANPAPTTGPLRLDVVASQPDGKPIGGLSQQQFHVSVNGKPESIVGFQAVEGAAAQVEVILVIDTVNAGFSTVAYERTEIERFLKQNQGRLAHPVSIAVITDTGMRMTPQSSTDGNELAAYLDKMNFPMRTIVRSTGFWGWVEKFQISATGLLNLATAEQRRPGRKLLIWVSPGWPLLSGVDVQLTNKEQDSFFSNLLTISTALREARITLYSVDPLGNEDADGYRTTFYKEFTKGVRSPQHMQMGNLALQVFALETGGRIFNSSNGITREIGQAVQDADAYYTIAVDPPPASSPNEYRSISVTVNEGALTARTMTGYYTQP